MSLVRNYNQALVVTIVDGLPAIGLMDGDSIRVTPNAESSAITTGVTESSTSFATDSSGTFELDFKPGSPMLLKLKKLHRDQRTFKARTFDNQLITGVGDPISLKGCSIMDIGVTTTGGKVMVGRTVIMNVEKIIEPI